MFDRLRRALGVNPGPRSGDINLSDSEHEEFTRLVSEHFKRLGRTCTVRGGIAVVADPPRPPHQYGLTSLERQCTKVTHDRWAAVVAEHFVRLDQADLDSDRVEKSLTDFAAVEATLCVQLARQGDVPLENLVWREDIPGLASYLVVDLPTSTRSVRPEDAACWGQNRNALFELALRNVWRLHKPQPAGIQFGDFGTCLACGGDGFFTATFALMLNRHRQAAGVGGALVTVPTSSKMFSMPIRDRRIHRVAPMLNTLTEKTFQADPRPISPSLYWYRQGVFRTLQYERTGMELIFHGPSDFLEMIAGLPDLHADVSE